MNTTYLPIIDPLKCIGCELCVKECPNGTLEMEADIVVVSNPDRCDYSGVCQEICPVEAISLIYKLIFSPTKGGGMANVTEK